MDGLDVCFSSSFWSRFWMSCLCLDQSRCWDSGWICEVPHKGGEWCSLPRHWRRSCICEMAWWRTLLSCKYYFSKVMFITYWSFMFYKLMLWPCFLKGGWEGSVKTLWLAREESWYSAGSSIWVLWSEKVGGWNYEF